MKLSTQFWLTSGALLCNLSMLSPSQAQIVPDTSLPIKSNIKNQGRVKTITGGTKAGANLFHSFEQFSIPAGSEAHFNNTLDIQNIIGRVTGSSSSSIEGLIQTNGIANLFLLNPNGITFGSDARLNVGGSFLASTASSINFADGTQFNARNPQPTPLLAVTVPIGLGFSNNPGEIHVQGPGSDVTALSFQPGIRVNQSFEGLQVLSQRTLAIVGGDLTLEGSLITAKGGRIELGSVESGLVSLSPVNDSGWSLGYEGVSTFKDIRLAQRSLANASGTGSGSIQVQGRRLQLSDGSLILIQNQGPLPTGTLAVNASESLEITEFGPSRNVYSGLWSETLGFGDGGEIIVSTPELTLQSSGQIYSATYGAAKAADISLTIPKSLTVVGLLPNELGGGTLIGSLALGTGQSGDIDISTGQLNIANGGVVLSANVTPVTFGLRTRGSGNINITASDVEVNGSESGLSVPSLISAATFSTGKAGNVTIKTSNLRVLNGGRIDSSTTALGTAGSVTIKASESVEIGGVAPGATPSLVTSAATTLDQSLQDTFGLFGDPSGASGKVLIDTKRLIVTDKGQISVRNEGRKSAGNLEIYADFLNLNNQGGITASTTEGKGGDISLQVQDLLLMQNSSSITATAGGTGTGGNITLDSNLLATLGNSNIRANAFKGQGGNIEINTQGFIRSPGSDISASSDLGIEGTVQVNTPDIDLSRATAPATAQPQAPEVSSVCQGRSGSAPSQFVKVGSGGIPPSPRALQEPTSVWVPQATQAKVQASVDDAQADDEFTPVRGWIVHPDGTVNFTSEPGVRYSSPLASSCSKTERKIE